MNGDTWQIYIYIYIYIYKQLALISEIRNKLTVGWGLLQGSLKYFLKFCSDLVEAVEAW